MNPKDLWAQFYALTQIPRPSKKEEKVRDYLVSFANELKLENFVDEVGNVIVKKPATPGMENRKGIILQAHLDMVPQKNNDKIHDFEKDPITAIIKDEWLCADGTTLGADNGIGVAAILAVLQSEVLVHGPIEALFTIDEETGLTGAFGIKPGMFNGQILLNLDSEEEGEFCIGCAGGVNVFSKLTYSEYEPSEGYTAFRVNLKGLKGGHSGVDINLGRGNANKLMFRFLKLTEVLNSELASIEGGTLMNAIPREAMAVVLIPAEKEPEFMYLAKSFERNIKNELSVTEPDISFTVSPCDLPDSIIDGESAKQIINAVYVCPNAVLRMIDGVPGLVETSDNLAIVKSADGIVEVVCSVRSSVSSAKDDLAMIISSVFGLAEAEDIKITGNYPGWKPNTNSEILNLMKDLYKKMFGEDPAVKVIHAGLECGVLGAAYDWDMISFGPTIVSPHSPDEKVNIESVEKFWYLLTDVLENVPLME